jgi:hypothetical protein
MAANGATALAAENGLLGSIVEDLQRKLEASDAEVGGLRAQLKQTEDALLDVHEEGKQMKSRVGELEAALRSERKLRATLQQRVQRQAADSDATVQVLFAELCEVEQLWCAEVESGKGTQLRRAAEEAIEGMREAQAECTWLHEQLQLTLKETGGTSASDPAASSGAALRMRLASAPVPSLASRTPSSAAASHHGVDGVQDGSSGGGLAAVAAPGATSLVPVPSHVGTNPSATALRVAYVRAVQRCHELQMHAASSAASDASARGELLRCRERLVELQHEADGLRSQLRRLSASSSAPGSAPSSAPSSAHRAGAESLNAVAASPTGLCMTPPSPPEPEATPPAATPPAQAPPSSLSSRTRSATGMSGGGGGAGNGRGSSGGGGGGGRVSFGGGAGQGGTTTPASSNSARERRSTAPAPPPTTPAGARSAAGATGGASAASQGKGSSGAAAEASALRTELKRAHAHISALERALERREGEHRRDLEAWAGAEREAECAHRTMMSERAWVQSLDEMRLDDIGTILRLEQCLQQWQARFERKAAR